MVLKKIPDFDEVKNWVNNNFNQFTSSDARTAVDGSSVSVGYADDAGTLNSQSPSYYENPTTTQFSNSTTGYVTNTLSGYSNMDYTSYQDYESEGSIDISDSYNYSFTVGEVLDSIEFYVQSIANWQFGNVGGTAEANYSTEATVELKDENGTVVESWSSTHSGTWYANVSSGEKENTSAITGVKNFNERYVDTVDITMNSSIDLMDNGGGDGDLIAELSNQDVQYHKIGYTKHKHPI